MLSGSVMPVGTLTGRAPLGLILVIGLILTACGGDDPDPTPTSVPAPSPTATAAANEEPAIDDAATEDDDPEPATAATGTQAPPTATEELSTPTTEPTPTELATATHEPTPTIESTSTTEPEPTSSADSSGQRVLPVLPDDADPEEVMLGWLLTEEMFPAGYQQVRVGSAVPPGLFTFCGLDEFADDATWNEGWIAGVESEHEVDETNGPFVLQSLAAYSGDTAAEAFAYNRASADACNEWEDPWDGTIFIELIDVPDVGDGSFGVRIFIDAVDFGRVHADFFIARFGEIVMTIGYAMIDESGESDFTMIHLRAVERLITIAGSS